MKYYTAEDKNVFIHRSIKTRIETEVFSSSGYILITVFIHRSIKTRIETLLDCSEDCIRSRVFIHRSIKTRIETRLGRLMSEKSKSFYT